VEFKPEWTQQIKRGDVEAFRQLHDQAGPKLYGYIWRKTRNEAVAQDLVQELFIRLWRNRGRLDPKQSLKAYLYTAASRLAIDHLRKKMTRDQFHNAISDSPSATQSHELDVIRKTEIRNALVQLSENQRTVFCLSRFESLTYREIADSLGVSIKTVETHMSRALSKMRELLGGSFSFLGICFIAGLVGGW